MDFRRFRKMVLLSDESPVEDRRTGFRNLGWLPVSSPLLLRCGCGGGTGGGGGGFIRTGNCVFVTSLPSLGIQAFQESASGGAFPRLAVQTNRWMRLWDEELGSGGASTEKFAAAGVN